MTPLEKAIAEAGRVNYCDECEQFKIVGNACYCKVDGKLIHPIMLIRGQGTGPAWNCKKRIKPITNYEKLIRKTPEEMAKFLNGTHGDFLPTGEALTVSNGEKRWLEWLRQEDEQ